MLTPTCPVEIMSIAINIGADAPRIFCKRFKINQLARDTGESIDDHKSLIVGRCAVCVDRSQINPVSGVHGQTAYDIAISWVCRGVVHALIDKCISACAADQYVTPQTTD